MLSGFLFGALERELSIRRDGMQGVGLSIPCNFHTGLCHRSSCLYH